MSERDSICASLENLEALIRGTFAYDPETGIFTRKRAARGGAKPRKAGEVVGSKIRGGYLELRVSSARLLAHRVAWWFVHGRWPKCYVDHINCIKTDNRIVNLREANESQSVANRKNRRRPESGYWGVYPAESKSGWVAKIRLGTLFYLGTFDSPEEAARVFDAKARELHGEFAVYNFPEQKPA